MDIIVGALRKSEHLLEVDAEGKNVKRRVPMPTDPTSIDKSTIYAKGFPSGSILESITEFFEQHLNPGHSIYCIRLRMVKGQKVFKGSVFVEFSSENESKRIAGLDLKTYSGEPMLMMMKNEYIEKKNKEYGSRKQKKIK